MQLPLPDQIDDQKVLMAVDPNKDVDGFHPTNVGKMALDLPTFLPATPYGIMELLERIVLYLSHIHQYSLSLSVCLLGRPFLVLFDVSIFTSNTAFIIICRANHSRLALVDWTVCYTRLVSCKQGMSKDSMISLTYNNSHM